MDKEKAHAEIPSIKVGIEKLNEFSASLERLHKSTVSRVDKLSESHKDQNFKKFEEKFETFWPTLLEFVGKNNDYVKHLQGKIKFIEEEYDKEKYDS
jgi:hypothetical protein